MRPGVQVLSSSGIHDRLGLWRGLAGLPVASLCSVVVGMAAGGRPLRADRRSIHLAVPQAVERHDGGFDPLTAINAAGPPAAELRFQVITNFLAICACIISPASRLRTVACVLAWLSFRFR